MKGRRKTLSDLGIVRIGPFVDIRVVMLGSCKGLEKRLSTPSIIF